MNPKQFPHDAEAPRKHVLARVRSADPHAAPLDPVEASEELHTAVEAL